MGNNWEIKQNNDEEITMKELIKSIKECTEEVEECTRTIKYLLR